MAPGLLKAQMIFDKNPFANNLREEEERFILKHYVGCQGAQARPGNSYNYILIITKNTKTKKDSTRWHKNNGLCNYLIKGRDWLIHTLTKHDSIHWDINKYDNLKIINAQSLENKYRHDLK